MGAKNSYNRDGLYWTKSTKMSLNKHEGVVRSGSTGVASRASIIYLIVHHQISRYSRFNSDKLRRAINVSHCDRTSSVVLGYYTKSAQQHEEDQSVALSTYQLLIINS